MTFAKVRRVCHPSIVTSTEIRLRTLEKYGSFATVLRNKIYLKRTIDRMAHGVDLKPKARYAHL